MDAKQISKLCIDGAKRYLDYIAAKPNGGVDEIGVTSIEQVKGKPDTLKLKITKKLFELDAVSFQLQTPGDKWRDFTDKEVRVKLYDKEKNILLVKVTSEVSSLMATYEANYWKVISDLKFLIQRVIDWYELNGSSLSFTKGRPSSKLIFDPGVIFEAVPPSQEQLKALELIFSNPVSYIWGAPGTGKTRFVLSYALLTYIKKNKKVLILAPTNVALEQIFNGIIEATDRSGIDKKRLLRLGFPSKSFATAHGDTCEIIGLEKQIDELEKQISIIASILGIDTETEKNLKKLLRTLNLVKSMRGEASNIIWDKKDVQAEIVRVQTKESQAKQRLQTIELEKKEVVRRKHAFSTKFLRVFSKKIDYDEVLASLFAKQEGLEKSLKLIEARIISANEQIQNHSLSLQKLKSGIQKASKLCRELGQLVGIDSKDILETALLAQLKEKEEERKDLKSMAEEYGDFSSEDLRFKLDEYQSELAKLSAYSLDERIASANVVGATIDAYLFRFKEKELNVAHIFIDEAGYASLIKSLTVYKKNVPVTLLGDHKQLPPVSEISYLDIEKDELNNDVFVWDQSSIFVEALWSAEEADRALAQYLRGVSPSFDKLKKSSLTVSYRFGKNMATTLAQYVYQNDGFSSALTEDTEVIIYDATNPPNLRERGNAKRANRAEAECIMKIIRDEYSSGEEFVILAPYRAQTSLLKKMMTDVGSRDQILTVHKSQGQEWDTVIYSPCDIGNGQRPWFTDSKSNISSGLNNVNTAVSRAKRRLIIVCSSKQWRERDDQLIAGLINAGTVFHTFDVGTRNLKN